MENEEQEGIVLETVDLENEGIVLPGVDGGVEEETETGTSQDTETQTTNEVDEEKESLKRALNAERKARKNAEKENKNFEARLKALEESNKAKSKTTEEELIDKGVDETIAKSIAAAIDKKQANNSDLANEIAELKFKSSLNEKSKEEGFEDIVDYADEIKDLMDKGLTIEQSYYAVTYDKPKTKDTKSEIERKVEARLQNNQARKNILGNVNSQAGAVAKSTPKINLSSEEKAIAAMSGMTAEEYAAIRDMDNNKDYLNYSKSKVKK
jgi:hypothetical protein